MKSILTVFTVFLTLSLAAQQRSSIEFSVGPSFSKITFDLPDYAPGAGFPFSGVEEKAVVLPEFRLGYAHRLTDHFYISTGLQGYGIGYSYSKDFIWPAEILNNETYKTDQITFVHRFLAVPLSVRWIPVRVGGFAPYIDAGASAGFYIGTREKQILENNTKRISEKIDDVNPVHFNAIAALGLQFSLGDRAALFLQPAVQYNLSEFATSTDSDVLQMKVELGGRVFFGN